MAPAPELPVRVLQPDARDRLIAGYAGLAIALSLFEGALAAPVPGLKAGLAHVVVIVALLRHGWGVCAGVALLQLLVGGLLGGTFLGPQFWPALAGTLASLATLAAAADWNRWLPRARLSAVGLSVLACLVYVLAAFAVVWLLFAPHPALPRALPPLLAAALVLGAIGGALGARVVERLASARAR